MLYFFSDFFLHLWASDDGGCYAADERSLWKILVIQCAAPIWIKEMGPFLNSKTKTSSRNQFGQNLTPIRVASNSNAKLIMLKNTALPLAIEFSPAQNMLGRVGFVLAQPIEALSRKDLASFHRLCWAKPPNVMPGKYSELGRTAFCRCPLRTVLSVIPMV